MFKKISLVSKNESKDEEKTQKFSQQTEQRTFQNNQSETQTTPQADEPVEDLKPQRTALHNKRIFIVSLLLTALLLVGVVITKTLLSQRQKFISPLPENTAVLSAQTQTLSQPKEVIGFLPFWNIKEEESQRYHLLTQVAFFALEIDANGNIKKLKDDNTQEPGWTAYKSQAFGTIYRKAKDSGAKVILTIQALDYEVISSVVNDPRKRKKVIQQSLEIINLKNLDGINIDFESGVTPTYKATQNFTQFIKEFKEALSTQNPNLTLSVDVFADAAKKVRLWDPTRIAEYVDHIIIMAYDFHRPSSQIAGPIAPVRGSPKHWEYDISKTLSDFSKSVPLEKIILGTAYYGYEWQTSSDNPYATTYPGSGSLATYKRIQSLISEKQPNLHWDEVALSPILTYTESGKTYQIYYENEASLGLKYDLVNESGLAGIAIWALGYDGDHPNLWNLLAEKFLPN
jgi:spore germination protein YaaH